MASLGTPAARPEIEIYFDEIEGRTVFAEVRDLFAEWRYAAREDGGLPHKARFDPHLAGERGVNLMLMRHEDGDFHYETVGSHIAALFGHDPARRRLSELNYPGAQAYLPRYKYCVETGAPLFAVQRKVSFGIAGASERLLLPVRYPEGGEGVLVYIRSRADNYDLIRAVFDASQHGVLVVTAVRDETGIATDLEITAVNSAAATLIGGEPVELVGRKLKELLPRLDFDTVWPDLMASLETGETRVHETLRVSGDAGGVYRISSARVADGLAITISDLSQLQKAMKTLETQHASLVKVNAELRSEVVRRRRLEAELKELAATDPLTGIANRRSFNEAMTECLETADGNAPQAALILFDIDDFKAINDHHGHPAGDMVLQSIARNVSAHFGSGAVFGRLGGEEFGVFLPDTPDELACRIAEDLRRLIEAGSYGIEAVPIKVTASFGVATLSPPADTDRLIALADEALYAAKRHGRNRVECNCDEKHMLDTGNGSPG